MKKRTIAISGMSLCLLVAVAVVSIVFLGNKPQSAHAAAGGSVLWSFDNFHSVIAGAGSKGVHQYRLTNTGDDGFLQPIALDEETYAFRTSDGHYLTADNGRLTATATDYNGVTQHFTIHVYSASTCRYIPAIPGPLGKPAYLLQTPGQASVQAFDGRYVNVHNNGLDKPVYADRDSEVRFSVFSGDQYNRGCSLFPL